MRLVDNAKKKNNRLQPHHLGRKLEKKAFSTTAGMLGGAAVGGLAGGLLPQPNTSRRLQSAAVGVGLGAFGGMALGQNPASPPATPPTTPPATPATATSGGNLNATSPEFSVKDLAKSLIHPFVPNFKVNPVKAVGQTLFAADAATGAVNTAGKAIGAATGRSVPKLTGLSRIPGIGPVINELFNWKSNPDEDLADSAQRATQFNPLPNGAMHGPHHNWTQPLQVASNPFVMGLLKPGYIAANVVHDGVQGFRSAAMHGGGYNPVALMRGYQHNINQAATQMGPEDPTQIANFTGPGHGNVLNELSKLSPAASKDPIVMSHALQPAVTSAMKADPGLLPVPSQINPLYHGDKGAFTDTQYNATDQAAKLNAAMLKSHPNAHSFTNRVENSGRQSLIDLPTQTSFQRIEDLDRLQNPQLKQQILQRLGAEMPDRLAALKDGYMPEQAAQAGLDNLSTR
jgi:hypothetical protein